MTPTFLVKLDTGSDTDLLAIADEIREALEGQFDVIDVKPWQQEAAASPLLPTLPVATPPVPPSA